MRACRPSVRGAIPRAAPVAATSATSTTASGANRQSRSVVAGTSTVPTAAMRKPELHASTKPAAAATVTIRRGIPIRLLVMGLTIQICIVMV
ncbi:hypothetical protein BFL35_01700 [Clavibacter michiganensis]|nr:hypothetical protein BFL35_01700 [Clavibacter michiganensis]